MQHPDASKTAADRPSLLAMFRRGGDAHVGQTLVRLAALAAAQHAAAEAEAVRLTPVPAEAHGWASGPVVSVLPGEPGSSRKDSRR